MLIGIDRFSDDLRCPACVHRLVKADDTFVCIQKHCRCFAKPFPLSGGTPALVDFEHSVLDRSQVENYRTPLRRKRQSSAKRFLRRHFLPSNQVVWQNVEEFLSLVRRAASKPRVLVVGGGAIGEGADALYAATDIELIGFDIYATEDVQLVADAHAIPFADGSFDGVWIQAVLEHVLEPHQVAAEVTRVLRSGGVVYAETPFLQGVHEAAYDFTRFSESGHRWLFRAFERVGSGAAMGPFAHLLAALGGAIGALTGSARIALAGQLAFFWLKWLDRLVPARRRLDHASAVWFLGVKTDYVLQQREVIEHYDLARSSSNRS